MSVNPNGTVPTLLDGDLVVYESAAIVQYLADKFPEKRLAPPVGTPARGKYYQWIHYAMSSLEPPAVTFFLHTTGSPVGRQHERIPQLVPDARAQLAAALSVTDRALAGRDYIIGEDFCAADVMVGSMAVWCMMLGTIADDLKNLQAYVSRIAARPAFLRAQAD
jgi:glutathione S-transferase